MLWHCQLLGGCSIILSVCNFPGSVEPLSSCLGHVPLSVACVNVMNKGREHSLGFPTSADSCLLVQVRAVSMAL